jgi:hypothetical protein
MRLGIAILCLCALSACSTRAPLPFTPADPVPVGAADTCGAAPYGSLIGQDATALEKVLILRQVRVIRPGTPVTEDFKPVRINFNIGADERIRTITCG